MIYLWNACDGACGHGGASVSAVISRYEPLTDLVVYEPPVMIALVLYPVLLVDGVIVTLLAVVHLSAVLVLVLHVDLQGDGLDAGIRTVLTFVGLLACVA